MLQVDENIMSLVQQILVAYENSISVTGSLIDKTYEMLEESEKELGKFNNRLRETLAQRASLRKKDFDNIVAEIESRQRERHQQVKTGLNEFIHFHETTVSQLRGLLDDARSGEMIDFRPILSEIRTRDDKAQKNLIHLIRDFQNEHEEIMAEIHRLLHDNNGPVKAKDFKAALGKFAVREALVVP